MALRVLTGVLLGLTAFAAQGADLSQISEQFRQRAGFPGLCSSTTQAVPAAEAFIQQAEDPRSSTHLNFMIGLARHWHHGCAAKGAPRSLVKAVARYGAVIELLAEREDDFALNFTAISLTSLAQIYREGGEGVEANAEVAADLDRRANAVMERSMAIAAARVPTNGPRPSVAAGLLQILAGASAVWLAAQAGDPAVRSSIEVQDDSCSTNGDCPGGQRCIRPAGRPYGDGICGTLVDSFGISTFGSDVVARSCTFSVDCGVGFECRKPKGYGPGLCIKRD